MVIEKNSFEIIENIRFYTIVFRNNKATNNPVASIIYMTYVWIRKLRRKSPTTCFTIREIQPWSIGTCTRYYPGISFLRKVRTIWSILQRRPFGRLCNIDQGLRRI